ncbi:hypothetical protein KBC59_03615 [Patescibacteria group bacterium]|nr:hypothetical protein [Patescibacteria group bacterium]
MNQIIPAILVQDEDAFLNRFRVMDGLVEWIQLDVLDGTLYPNTSWCDFAVLKQEAMTSKLELHLMVDDPEKYIRSALDIESIGRILWHVEGMGDHRELLELVRSHKKEAGLAISPNTPASALEPYRGRLDEILVLGVQPGFSGQKLIPETIEKAAHLSSAFPGTLIGFDGGVNSESFSLLKAANVTYFCAASVLFNAPDPVMVLEQFQQL